MKKQCWLTLLSFVLLPHAAAAADVRIVGSAPFQTIGTVIWNNLTNTYVMDSTGAVGFCLNIQNNVGTNFGFNLTAYSTADLGTTTFTGNTGAWSQVTISPAAASTTPQYTALATGTGTVLQLWVFAPGAAHFALAFSSPTASASNTVTIRIAQTGSRCGAINTWSTIETPAAATACNAAAGVVPAITGVSHVAQCVSVSMVAGAAPAATTLAMDIRDGGAAGNCTTGTIKWSTLLGVPATVGSSQEVAVCGLNLSGAKGATMQLCSEAAPGAAVSIRCSMSGFDQ